MISLDIPGFGHLALEHLVLDYNGTLAFEGRLIPGVAEMIRSLAASLTIHVLTADTRGGCRHFLTGLPVQAHILSSRPEDRAKLDFIKSLGPETCACIGNGRNDRFMLEACALGLAVVGEECAATSALTAADLVAPNILRALGLFVQPLRLMATLRT